MNATSAKRLTGLLMVTALFLNLITPSIFTLWQSVSSNVARRHDAASENARSTTQAAAPKTIEQTKERAGEAYGKLPISFEANRGQTDPSVKFLARGNGYGLFLTQTEAVLSLHENAKPRGASDQKAASARGAVLRMKLVGGNLEPTVAGLEQLPGSSNYFLGSDPKNWRTGTPSYAKVKYEQVYPGVDLLYYGNQQQLEYDFVLAPGAQADQIKLNFAGAEGMRLDENGALLLDTANGQVRQHRPVAYQTTDKGERELVAANYVLDERRAEVGFQVAQYDTSRPLVIDPVVSLVYGARFGGSNSDSATDLTVDAAGNAYVTGHTFSLDFPTTAGALDTTGDSVYNDIFVSKLSADGTELLYSSYIGGNQPDSVTGIAVDASDNIYLSGYTGSTDFPTTAGAFQTTTNGVTKAFVLKLNPALTGAAQLAYSTFLGGSFRNYAMDIAVDGAGRIYVSGETESTDFPTRNAYQPNYSYTYNYHPDAFFVQLNPAGAGNSDLLYSTYLGRDAGDSALRIAVDGAGNAYIGGHTNSTTFPTTAGAFKTTRSPSGSNIFIAKFNPSLAGASSLLYSTYFGGSSGDSLSDLKLDASGNVYVTGGAFSQDFPVTPNAIQSVNKGAAISGAVKTDAFVSKLNLAGAGANDLLYSTYLGGADSSDGGSAVGFDAAGNIYLLGSTGSPDFPVSACGSHGAYRGVPFIAKIDPVASGAAGLLYSSTFSGSTGPDSATSMIVDANGQPYVAGGAFSADFPDTPGAYHSATSGSNQPFVLKFNQLSCAPPPTPTPTPTPEPTPTPTPTPTPNPAANGKIVFLSYEESSYADIYTVNPDGTGMARLTNTETFEQTPVFSPDGNTIAFSRNSRLYLMNWDGSNQRQISTTAFHNGFALKWSPDGTKIAFDTNYQDAGGQEIAVINADGTGLMRLTNEPGSQGNFAWSPDGTKILYDSTDGDIHMMNADGTNHVNLTNSPQHELEISWSPDGSKIAFTRIQSNYTIFSMNADGTGQTQLTSGTAQDHDPVFSPDGTRIAFRSHRDGTFDPFVMNADGSNETKVVDANMNIQYSMEWSPDSTKLLFVDSPNGISEMYVVNTDGSGLTNVSNHPTAYDDNYDWQNATAVVTPTPTPTPTPYPGSNGKIAFVSERDGDQEIYVMNADGSEQTNITNNSPQSWSSDFDPVFSPDGTKIAFASNRNAFPGLYVMNADGSNVVQIPGTGGTSPTWSPDGKQIAYMINQDIYKVNVDGTNGAQLTGTVNNSKPAWSPDGQHIAFQSYRAGQHEIYVMRQDGSNVTRLTTTPGMGAYEPKWSPNGAKIVFHSYRGQFEIFTMNADGSNQTQITNNTVEDFSAFWSPDGSKIVFTSMRDGTHEIYVMDADGNNQTRLTNVPFKDYSPTWQRILPPPPPRVNGNIAFTHFGQNSSEQIATIDEDGSNLKILTNGNHAEDSAVSPDGKKIAFSAVFSGQFQIWVMNSDGSQQTRLTNNQQRGDYEPAWSPDGSKIAFVGNNQIWVINADGTNEVKISDGTTVDDYPDWSPDGQKIVFTKDARSGNAQTFVMNADGSNPVNLSNTYWADRDPAWSPDGQKIAYYSFQNGHYEIYVMNADGSNQTRLTDTPYQVANMEPDWSPDGSKIVFTSTRAESNNFEIYVMNADGSLPTRVTNDPAQDTRPSWGRYVPTPPPTPTPTPTPTPAQTDLSLLATVSPDSVQSGGTVLYVMNVVNNGPATATAATLSHQLPAGVSVTTINNGHGSCTSTPDEGSGGTRVDCSLGDIPNGETRSMTIEATATGSPYNWMQAFISVTSSTQETYTNDNYAYPGFQILGPPEANLWLNASAQPTVVESGGTVDFNTTVYNYGPFTATGATLTATLPAGLTVNTASTTETACTVTPISGGGTTVSCPLGDMPIYTQQTVAINATVNAANGTDLRTSISVASTLPDSNMRDNTGGSTLLVRAARPGPGGKLAFVSYRDGNAEIYVANADGSNAVNLTNNPGYDWEPAWSPDGSKLVFSSRRSGVEEVWVMNADGSNQTQLTTNGSNGVYFVWSNDGTKIAWQDYRDGNYDISVINADGTGFLNLTNDTDYQDRPQWSPDGTKVMYEDYGNAYTSEVYVINADGTGKTNLTNSADTSDYSPVWSPDGTKIAFAKGRANEGIYVMNADGSNQVNLTNTEFDGYPSWSPDGSKIAFSRYVSFIQMIYVMNADGSSQTPVFTAEYNGGAKPEWSPDGTGLAFDTYKDGNSEVYVANVDGSGLTNVSNHSNYDFQGKWQPTASTPSGDTPAGNNVTVTENGVTVTFSNVTTAGETTVTPIDPNSLQGIPGEYVINANSLAFEITTTAAYSGPITIGFQVPGINNPITFSTLRVLHGEPPPVPNFVDRTVLAPDSPSHDFGTRTIYARVTSLSPFVVVERASGDTTPPDIQITQPTDTVYLLHQTVAAGYSCTDAGGSGVAQCVGAVASGALINTNAAGTFNFTVNARDNAGNTATRTVNYRVAYNVRPLFDQATAHKSGSTVPIKLELVDAAGVNQSAANVTVSAVSVVRISDDAPGALASPGEANPDLNFRYQSSGYQFNLKTTGYATGTYRLSFKAGNDPVTHTVQFQVK